MRTFIPHQHLGLEQLYKSSVDKLSISHSVYRIVYWLVDSCGGKFTRDWRQSVRCVLSLQCPTMTAESDYTGRASLCDKGAFLGQFNAATPLLPRGRAISLAPPQHYKRFMFTSCFLVSVLHQPRLLLKRAVFSPLLVPCGTINCTHCCLFIVLEHRPAIVSELRK